MTLLEEVVGRVRSPHPKYGRMIDYNQDAPFQSGQSTNVASGTLRTLRT